MGHFSSCKGLPDIVVAIVVLERRQGVLQAQVMAACGGVAAELRRVGAVGRRAAAAARCAAACCGGATAVGNQQARQLDREDLIRCQCREKALIRGCRAAVREADVRLRVEVRGDGLTHEPSASVASHSACSVAASPA